MATFSTTKHDQMLHDKKYYVALIRQYLASLSSSDPMSPHTISLSEIDPTAVTTAQDESLKVPPLPEMLHQQIQQIEYPTLLNPKGATSDRETILKRAELAKHIITDSKFRVQSILVSESESAGVMRLEDEQITTENRPEYSGDWNREIAVKAAVEALWTGTVAKDLSDKLAKGAELRARFAMFFEFRGGLVYRQSNYDCFDPF